MLKVIASAKLDIEKLMANVSMQSACTATTAMHMSDVLITIVNAMKVIANCMACALRLSATMTQTAPGRMRCAVTAIANVEMATRKCVINRPWGIE